MTEQEIKKRFKIQPLTLNRIKEKFKGSTTKRRGRVIYQLKDEDIKLLSVARLDPYTFREKFSFYAPYHNYLIYLLLTLDEKEVIDECRSRRLIHAERITRTVKLYRKAVISLLPPSLARWYKEGQDFPDSEEDNLRRVFRLLDCEGIYNNPELLNSFDFIMFDPHMRNTIETFLSCCDEVKAIKPSLDAFLPVDIPMEGLEVYRSLIYDIHYMTVHNWKTYLKTLTLEDQETKSYAYGNTVREFLREQKLHRGLQVNDFIQDMFYQCKKDWSEADYHPPKESVTIRNSALRNFILVKDLLPEDTNEANSMKEAVENNMRAKKSVMGGTFDSDKDEPDDREIV